MSRVEILAPVGSPEALTAAVRNRRATVVLRHRKHRYLRSYKLVSAHRSDGYCYIAGAHQGKVKIPPLVCGDMRYSLVRQHLGKRLRAALPLCKYNRSVKGAAVGFKVVRQHCGVKAVGHGLSASEAEKACKRAARHAAGEAVYMNNRAA